MSEGQKAPDTLNDWEVRETGWLIETAQNTYWDGRQSGRDAVFVPDANKAIRFARQEDAEIVRSWLLEEPRRASRLKSTEHVFIGRKK